MKNLFFASHTLTPMRKSIPLVTTVAFSLLYNSFLDASEAKAYGDIRFRYENVQQDNAAQDANALVARVQAGIKTAEINGFSAETAEPLIRTRFMSGNKPIASMRLPAS